MSRPRSFSLLLFLVVVSAFLIVSAVPSVQAQTLASTAGFSGSVSDSSGARVANASVTLSSAEKGITRVFKTDGEGNFSFSLLPAGTYTLTVSASGFKTFKQEAIALEVGQSGNQSITLTIGSSEQIEVTAEAPLLQTDNANVGAEVSAKQVTDLPLNLRNVFNFVQLNSSVNNLSQQQLLQSGGGQSTADQDVSFFNFGGAYFGTTAFLLDGAWDTTTGWGGVIYVPSPDNVQEFKVQQNSFTAQYGWSTGNVINVVTKSGGSGLHGDVYEYLRNGALDANYYFNNLSGTPRPNTHRNQFGASIGGPVYIPGIYKQRSKTFFYFNYESHRENDPTTPPISTVPIAAFRTGDYSSVLGSQAMTCGQSQNQPCVDALGRPVNVGAIYDPFSTRQITAGQVDPVTGLTATSTGFIRDPIAGNNLANAINGIDPVGQALVNFYPGVVPNLTGGNWTASGLAANNSNEYSGRVDHNVSDKTRLYGRFSYKTEFKDQSPAYFGTTNPAGPGQRNPNNRWNLAVGANHVFSSTFTMSVNLGGMKWVEGNVMQSAGFKPSSLGLPSFIDTASAQFPVINAGGYLAIGPLAGAGTARFPRSSESGSVDFVKVRGAHQLSFGYMGVAIDENGGRIVPTTFNFTNGFTAGPDPQSPTAGTGDSVASMLLGAPSSGSTGQNVNNVSRTWLHGVYLQDDWKATRKLTLNLGLRWEVQRPMTDRFNRLFTFNYNAANPACTAAGLNCTGVVEFATSGNRGQYDANYKHFAPRVGFAYQLMPKLVMRGGYGIFFPNQYLNSPQITGYNSLTPYVASLNGGISPCTNAGPCTLSHALYLSAAFPNGPVPITGNSLGTMTNVGFSTGAVAPNRKTYYGEQWMYGIQYAPTRQDVIDVTYVGNHSVHTLASGLNLNQLDPKYFSMGNALLTPVANPFLGHITSSGCGLDQPTVAQGQLLRPHPEFCDINETDAPAGGSHYNALDVNYTHRVSQGLTLLASYTFSKFIDNIGGPETWASASANFSENVRNVYNLAAETSVDATDIPHSLVLSYVYELPVGKGKKYASGMGGVVNAILGGWQTTGIATFKSGFPLQITPSTNPNPFGIGQHVNVVGNYHLAGRSRTEWFNTAAFVDAPQFDLGNAPRYFSDLRSPHYNNWDISIQKYFPVHESVRFQFRLDMFNAFNHTNFYRPNTSLGNTPADTPPGTYGEITQSWSPRQMQAALKLYW